MLNRGFGGRRGAQLVGCIGSLGGGREAGRRLFRALSLLPRSDQGERGLALGLFAEAELVVGNDDPRLRASRPDVPDRPEPRSVIERSRLENSQPRDAGWPPEPPSVATRA